MIEIEEMFRKKNRDNLEVHPAAGGLPPGIWTTVSAFANTSGGVILLGVERNRETGELTVVGVRGSEKIILDFWKFLETPGRLSANIFFKGNVYVKEMEGKEVVVIEVPKASRYDAPVYTGHDVFTGSYRRSGSGDRKCTRDEIRSMLRLQEERSDDRRLLWRWNLSALDFDTVARYRAVFNRQHPGHPWQDVEDEEFLVRVCAAARGEDRRLHPTLGGVIFFGEHEAIQQELPRYSVDFRRLLPSGSGWSGRIASGDGDWSGNVFDFYCRIIDSLTKLPTDEEEKEEVQITDPEGLALLNQVCARVGEGIGEIFSNALIHADYRGNGGIVVDRGRDWTTVSNPGTFIGNCRDAMAGSISELRNDVISRLFALIHVGNRGGKGLPRVMQTWERLGLKKPQILENYETGRVSVTIEHRMNSLEEFAVKLAAKEKENGEADDWLIEETTPLDAWIGEQEELSAAGVAEKERNSKGWPGTDASGKERDSEGRLRMDVSGKERDSEGLPVPGASMSRIEQEKMPEKETFPEKHSFRGQSESYSGIHKEGNPDVNHLGVNLDDLLAYDELTEVDERVLSRIRSNNRLTVKEIAEELEISMSTVNRSLKHLKKMGKIRRYGATRGKWILL